MPSKDLPKDLLKELIIGFGFLEGLWIYAGVNPTTEITNALLKIAPEGMFSGVFPLILILLPLVQIAVVYAYGGVIGLIALGLAFLGGILLGTEILWVILIILALLLGYWAFSMENKIGFLDIIKFTRKV